MPNINIRFIKARQAKTQDKKNRELQTSWDQRFEKLLEQKEVTRQDVTGMSIDIEY